MLKVSTNPACRDSAGKDVAHNWGRNQVELDWLLGNCVSNGYTFCATHFSDRHRCTESATGSNLIVVDVDGDCTLEQFWATTTAQQWCAATYTTKSHLLVDEKHPVAEHRFRALFPLQLPLSSAEEHRALYYVIAERLCNELDLPRFRDNCGACISTPWAGNRNAIVRINDGAIVPDFLIEGLSVPEQQSFDGGNVTPIDVRRCIWLLDHFLQPSEEYEYNSHYMPVTAACASIGDQIEDAWVRWVQRGHHGLKAQNYDKAKKWTNLNLSNYKKLYSLAKEQDPNWTKQLPTDLIFDVTTGNAAGYPDKFNTSVDPEPDYSGVTGDADVSEADATAVEEQPDVVVEDKQSPPAKRGRPRKNASDLAKERQKDVEDVRGVLIDLRRNLLTGSMEYDQGHVKIIEGKQLDLLTTEFAVNHNIFIPEARMKSAVQWLADQNAYCPIRHYLDHCEQTAAEHEHWHCMAGTFLGNNDPLANLTLQRLMIGAVARCYKPGCDMSWLPILVGPQGAGKSMFARSLVPESLFSEVTAPLELLTREPYRLHLSWMLELPEIDHLFQRHNIEHFKNMVTTRVDEVRYPYDPLPTKKHRRFVMIGTTNRAQFLIDPTGNRRFMPLELGRNHQVPWQLIAEQRDSLWKSAIAAYKRGETHQFTSGEIAENSDYIEQFNEPDAWLELIDELVKTHKIRLKTKAKDVLNAIGIDPKHQTRRETSRVHECLRTLGYVQLNTSHIDKETGIKKSVRYWVHPRYSTKEETPEETDYNEDF